MLELSDEEQLRVTIGTVQAQLEHIKAANAALLDRVMVAEGLLQLAMVGEPCNCREAQILRNCVLAFGFEDDWWLERPGYTPEQWTAEFETADAEFRFQHGIEYWEK
ncbi:hypothetical protein [Parahaliea mediterranea]|uniref:hypothetical protein n=1 Tax=Parahaliea mediterranea TaxID=651086 RepID=UPI000E2FC10D|nr:hypothetical protein [Parahaliea mediterranea]